MRNSVPFHKSRRLDQGLTLVEILVASALLLMITLGLTLMFTQTQRAFQGGVRQSDVSGGGRVVMDFLRQDFEQLTASATPGVFNMVSMTNAVNYQYENGNPVRTNVITEAFILTNPNRDWMGVAYLLTNFSTGFGSLHRYTVTNIGFPTNLYLAYTNDLVLNNFSNCSRVVDGVVHFRVQPILAKGVVNTNGPVISFPHENTNLPVAVEIELGVLEPQTYEQLKGIPIGTAQTEFLKRQASKVHIFRQQIPIRTAAR